MEIPKNVEVLDWQTSYLWFDEDGVMFSMPKPGAEASEHSRENSERQMEELRKLTGGRKLCMVIETNRHSKAPRKEDRDYIAAQLSSITKALAIITTSPLSRMIANLFFGLKPPSYPVKFFSNEKESKEWIRQFLDK